jgi:hypothetical protein
MTAMLEHRRAKGNPDSNPPDDPFRTWPSNGNLPARFEHAGAGPARDQEDRMAKGQMKSNKEKKKPKADDGKVKQLSAYKAAQQGSGKK